jgi:hypothetical protein
MRVLTQIFCPSAPRRLLLVACLVALTGPAHAAVTVTVSQQGADVVMTGSGSLDTTDWGGIITTAEGLSGIAAYGVIGLGMSGPVLAFQFGPVDLISPTNLGGLGATFFPGDTDSGDFFTIASDNGGVLAVPVGYVSGAPLSGTASFEDTTLAALGVSPGTYAWTWGSGPSADAFNVQILGPPKPAPSMNALGMIILSSLLGLVVWRTAHSKSRAQSATNRIDDVLARS